MQFLLLLFLAALPFEPLVDKAHRTLMFLHTDIPKPVILSLYFFFSEFFLLSIVFFFRKKITWKSSPFLGGAFLFTFFIVLSIFLSPYPTDIKYYMMGLRACLMFVFMLLILNMDSKGFFRRLSKVMCMIGAFEGLIATLQYFLQGPVGLRFLGEPKIAPPLFQKVGFQMQHYSLTLFDYFTSFEPGHLMRAYGTLDHPNVLGGILSMTLILSYFYYLHAKNPKLVLIGICFQILGLFVTFSRNAMIAILLGSILWALFMRREEIKKLGIVVISFTIFCFILFAPQLTSRGGVVNYNATAGQSDQGRLEGVYSALHMIKQKPFFGVGLENFMKHLKFEKKRPILVHNIFFLTAAENGLIACGLLFYLIYLALRQVLGHVREKIGATLAVLFLMNLFIGCFDFYPLFFHQYKYYFFLVFTLTQVQFGRKEYAQPVIS